MVFIIFLFAALSLAAATPVQITVSNQKDTSVGLNGRVNLFVSTAFQPAEWDNTFFQDLPSQTTVLGQMAPMHINIQPQSQGLAQTGLGSWDFTVNNSMLPSILSVGDHDPIYQVASAPAFMETNGALAPANFPQFAAYSANMVRYFNTGGFDAGGKHFQSPSPYQVTWWGIFNEPDVNNVSASDYPALYNTVVPAMQAVDPNIKFVALELAYLYDYLPEFLSQGESARGCYRHAFLRILRRAEFDRCASLRRSRILRHRNRQRRGRFHDSAIGQSRARGESYISECPHLDDREQCGRRL